MLLQQWGYPPFLRQQYHPVHHQHTELSICLPPPSAVSPVIPQILVNLLLLIISVLVILKGVKTDRLEIVNYGLLILSAQIICRFFDTEMSFLLRGLLFIIVGAGFFFTNYRMLNRRKSKIISLSKSPEA